MSPLKHIRLAMLDMTQVDLAARLGVRALAVSRWETGARAVPHERVRPILRALFEERGLAWHDSLLFEVPVCDDCHSPGSCVPVCARMAGDGCALEARAPVGEAA